MTRRTFFSCVIGLVMLTVTMIGTTRTATAQCPFDCTFLITASCSIPPHCFPIQVWTNWQQGMMNVTKFDFAAPCGTWAYPQPAPCPPLWNIKWASLDGGATKAFPGGPAVRNMLPCGIFVCISVTIAPNGCANVIIVPC